MNLQEKIERAGVLLESNKEVIKKASIAKFVQSLDKAVSDFLKKFEPELYRSTSEYVDLAALIDAPTNRKVLTKQWFDDKANLINRKFAKFTKKEKEELIIELVKTGQAQMVIDGLKTTPEKRSQNLFSELANLSESESRKRVDKMKSKEIEEFCEHNAITIERTKKGAFDKKKTLAHVSKKLQTVRDYLKL